MRRSLTGIRLAHINTLLLVAIFLVNGYIVALPLLPGILFHIQSRDTARIQQLETRITPTAKTPTHIPQENRLIIPSMLLDEPINDGPGVATLQKGLWRLPHGSNPQHGSNTVIVGHRMTYTNPRGTFYNLDKVRIGDTIGIWWNKVLYRYTVVDTKVTQASNVAIEAPTSQPQITLYTCTPLWLPHDRLVVTAINEKEWQQ